MDSNPITKVTEINLKVEKTGLKQFTFRGWDCERFEPDYSKLTFKLSQIGFTLTNRDLPLEPISSQYDNLRSLFSDLTAEMFLRSYELTSPFVTDNRRFEDQLLGNKSADFEFCNQDLETPTMVYEIKSTLFKTTEQMIDSMMKETSKKYAGINRQVTMIHLVLDRKFPKRIKLGPNGTKLYHYILSLVMRLRHLIKDSRLLLRDQPRGILNIFDRIASTLRPEDILPPSAEYRNLFDDHYNDSWFDLIKQFEVFYNANYMVQNDAARLCLNFLRNKKSTIHPDHPWDRDKNLEKYTEWDCNFGHRADYLVHWPIHKGIDRRDDGFEYLISNITEVIKIREFLPTIGKHGALFNELVNTYSDRSDYIGKLREKAREFAYLHTEGYKDDELKPLINERISSLTQEYRSLLENANKGLDLKRIYVTKNGYFRVKLTDDESYKMGINRDANIYFKNSEDHIDWETIDFKYDEIQNIFPRGPGYKVVLKDFYVSDTNINDESNHLLSSSKDVLDEILSTRQSGYLDMVTKFERGYLAAFPGHSRKKTQHNDFGVFGIPGISACVVATAPCGITSGALVVCAMLKLGVRFPNCYLPYDYIDLPERGYTIALSRPFRVQMDIINKRDELFASWVSLTCLSEQYGCTMHNDAFFNSFWWSYTRMLSLSCDVVYLLLKNSINFGTMGKKGYVKKFEGLMVKDVRVATLVKNLWENYSNCVTDMQKYVSKKGGEFLNIRDPVFKLNHKSIQTFMIIIYLKQIFPKHDAFDEDYVAMKHIFNEWEFKSIFDKSEFNPSNGVRPETSLNLKEWALKTLVGESWVPISYHPDICYQIGLELVKEAMENNPSIVNGNNFIDHKAFKTGKSSKVLMYDNLLPDRLKKQYKKQEWARDVVSFSVKSGKFESKAIKLESQEPGRLKGVQSVVLTEALAINIMKFKEYLRTHKEELGVENMTDVEIDSYEPSLSEIVYFHFLTSPTRTVLSVKVKDQKGYDKRIFFIQTADGRDKRKFADESFNALLKAVDEDMIMEAGDEKNKMLEEKMSRLNFKFKDGLIITEDQTKYGDLYPLEAFKCLISALRDTGYFTQDQASFVWATVNGIRKRVILIPPNMKKMLENEEKFKLTRPESTLKGKAFWERFRTAKAIEISSEDGRTWEGFEEERVRFNDVVDSIRENIGMRKDVGFILGVFNKMGSVLSAGQLWIQKYYMKLLGLDGLVQGSTHSDDSIKFFGIPQPKLEDMTKVEIDECLRLLKRGYRFSIGADRTRISLSKNVNGVMKSRLVKTVELSKIIQITSLICPRLVGQRPSTEKWGVGPTGEVLQLMAIAGRMIPPIMRFANAIGAELPGQSPANDLYSAVGRVYQLASNGMTTKCLSTMMLVANWFVYSRFGFEQKDMYRVNKLLPELGGYVWFYPPLILRSGFYSNDIRLLSLARYEKDHFVKNQFKLMMDTDEVFKQRILQAKTGLSEEVSVEAESADNEGSAVARKDFVLRYVKNLKTQYTFQVLAESNREMLNSFIRKLKTLPYTKEVQAEFDSILLEKKNSVFIRRLKNITTDRTLSHTGEHQDSMVSFLNKYITESYQVANLRIPEGVQLVNRLGYRNRQFSSPWSPKFIAKFGIRDKEIWRLKEIIDKIIRIAESGPIIMVENSKLLEIVIASRDSMISDLMSIRIKIESEREATHDREYKLAWERLSFNLSHGLLRVDASVMVAIYIQQQMMGLQVQNLPVVKSKPTLFASEDVLRRVIFVNELLVTHGFGLRDVLKNPQVFSKIFEEKGYLGFCRGIVDRVDEMNMLAIHNYDFSKVRVGRVTANKKKTSVIEKNEVGIEVAFRVLSVAYSMSLFENANLRNFRFISGGNQTFSFQLLLDKIRLPWNTLGINSFSYNCFLLTQLFEFQQGINPVFVLYRYKLRETIVVGCNYQGDYYFLEHFQSSEYGNRYFAYTSNTDPLVVSFFLNLINYFLLPKEMRFMNLADGIISGHKNFGIIPSLKNDSVDYSQSIFKIIGQNNLQYSGSGVVSSEIRYMPAAWFATLKEFCFKSTFTRNSVVINYPKGKYLVQLWRFPRAPSGWIIERNGVKFSDEERSAPEDEPNISSIGYDRDGRLVKELSCENRILQYSVCAVNCFKSFGGEPNMISWNSKMFGGDIVEMFRYIHFSAGGWSSWLSFLDEMADAEEEDYDKTFIINILTLSNLIDDDDLEIFSPFVSAVMNRLRQINSPMGNSYLKSWQSINYIGSARTTQEKKKELSLFNSTFGTKIEQYNKMIVTIQEKSNRLVFKGRFNEPEGYSSQLFFLYVSLFNSKCANMLNNGINYRPSLVVNGQIDKMLAYTILVNYKGETNIMDSIGLFNRV